MEEGIHLTEGQQNGWELYRRIEEATRRGLAKDSYSMLGGDHSINDIVVEGDGIKLVGKYGYSGLVYEWFPEFGKDWVSAYFQPEPKVPYEPGIKGKLLSVLERHFGEPTEHMIDNSGETHGLVYQLPIGKRMVGKRIVHETYVDGASKEIVEEETTEPIVRTLILQLYSLAFVLEAEREKTPTPGTLQRIIQTIHSRI